MGKEYVCEDAKGFSALLKNIGIMLHNIHKAKKGAGEKNKIKKGANMLK